MRMFKLDRVSLVKFLTLLLAGGLLCVGGINSYLHRARASQVIPEERRDDNGGRDRGNDREKYLFVWSGDQGRTNPDFLAVINFDSRSSDYGHVITTLPLPGRGATGNEPHHVGLSSDGRVLACGGLLSVLKGQQEIFFFDVSDPTSPRFISAADPPLSAITDEFYPLATGGFLVTMMGGAEGHHPGRVVEFNRDLQLVTEHPQSVRSL